MAKNEWVQLFERVGFPMVVAFYFMFRMERVLERVIEVLSSIQVTMAGLQ